MEIKKVCTACKDEKVLSQFPKAHSTKDGRGGKCCECERKDYVKRKPTDDYKDNYFTHDKYYS